MIVVQKPKTHSRVVIFVHLTKQFIGIWKPNIQIFIDLHTNVCMYVMLESATEINFSYGYCLIEHLLLLFSIFFINDLLVNVLLNLERFAHEPFV